MLSKVLPRGTGSNPSPFVYRTLNVSGTPAELKPAQTAMVPVASGEEGQRLRVRVAELEHALASEVAAARQAGLREGEAAGRRDGDLACKPVLDRLARSIHEIIELKLRYRKELEEDAVQLSLAIAKRILRRELNIDPSALHGLVQVAFERMGRNEVTRVVAHPEHVAAIRETLALVTTRQIEIHADGSREKGTLIFETTRGALDASVDSQLREIELGLADRLKWR